MTNYVQELADAIRNEVPQDILPTTEHGDLFRMYAVLLLGKGSAVEAADVHNAWSAWMSEQQLSHPSIVPFDDLDVAAQRLDQPFVDAVRRVAMSRPATSALERRLFPQGLPVAEADRATALELYKVIVASSEGLVSRRQTSNTFFLTAVGVLLTGLSLLVGSKANLEVKFAGVAGIGVTGCILSQVWASLVRSYGQLNAGKFRVINRIERELPLAVYDAEWLALGEGRDPAVYQSFTSREAWLPKMIGVLFGLVFCICIGLILRPLNG